MTRAMVVLAGGLLAGCLIEGGDDLPVPKGGGPVVVDEQQNVTLDTERVPVVPSCQPTQVIRRNVAGDGWECAEVTWNKVAGRPSEFPPAAHTHPPLEAQIAQILES